MLEMKIARHAQIIKLINQYDIETQEELAKKLEESGFAVTQATISRDIKDLHLFKVSGIEKKYRYAYINDSEGEISPKMKNLFRDCVVALKCAQNMVVIKTLTGNGPNAGTVVDKLNYPEIVGSVAGDDTLLIVCESNEAAVSVIDKINDFMK